MPSGNMASSIHSPINHTIFPLSLQEINIQTGSRSQVVSNNDELMVWIYWAHTHLRGSKCEVWPQTPWVQLLFRAAIQHVLPSLGSIMLDFLLTQRHVLILPNFPGVPYFCASTEPCSWTSELTRSPCSVHVSSSHLPSIQRWLLSLAAASFVNFATFWKGHSVLKPDLTFFFLFGDEWTLLFFSFYKRLDV